MQLNVPLVCHLDINVHPQNRSWYLYHCFCPIGGARINKTKSLTVLQRLGFPLSKNKKQKNMDVDLKQITVGSVEPDSVSRSRRTCWREGVIKMLPLSLHA